MGYDEDDPRSETVRRLLRERRYGTGKTGQPPRRFRRNTGVGYGTGWTPR